METEPGIGIAPKRGVNMWNGSEWFWVDYERSVHDVLSSGPNVLDVGSPVPLRKELQAVQLPQPPPRLWTLDFPGPWETRVDVFGDAASLPFRDQQFDGLICKDVLEHVRFPRQAAAELIRVLRPGGKLFVTMIFVHPYHAAHYGDFWRFTTDAVDELFPNLELQVRPAGGWAFIARAYAPARLRGLLLTSMGTRLLNFLDKLIPAGNATVMNYVLVTKPLR